ncbi:MAG: YciI family protein [Thermomicrobiales bacterium]
MIKYAIFVKYSDNHDLRVATRPSHREFLKRMLDEGKLHESGPFTDDSGALMVYNAGSKDEVEAIVAEDPFRTTPGIVDSAEIYEWNVVFPVVES